MGNLGEMLNRRLLGIPAWLWGLIIGGAIVGISYIRSRNSGPTPAPAASPAPDESLPADAGDIAGVPEVQPSLDLTTNPAWQRYVEDAAVAAGDDPVLVHNALTKVLAGIEVTDQERAMWETLIRRYGAPPEGAPPIVVTPTPTQPPPSQPQAPKPAPPAKPSVGPSIRVTKVTRNSVTLSWWSVPRATTYYLYSVSPVSGEHKLNVGNRTSYTWGNLAAGRTYSFYVSGANPQGEGPRSNVIRATTKKR